MPRVEQIAGRQLEFMATRYFPFEMERVVGELMTVGCGHSTRTTGGGLHRVDLKSMPG